MPSNLVRSPEDEKHWERAKASVKQSHPDLSEDDDRFWRLVTGAFEHMKQGTGSKPAKPVAKATPGLLRRALARIGLAKADVKEPGKRGGKFYYDKHGNVLYGEAPAGHTQLHTDHASPVTHVGLEDRRHAVGECYEKGRQCGDPRCSAAIRSKLTPRTGAGSNELAADRAAGHVRSAMKVGGLSAADAYARWERTSTFGPKLKARVLELLPPMKESHDSIETTRRSENDRKRLSKALALRVAPDTAGKLLLKANDKLSQRAREEIGTVGSEHREHMPADVFLLPGERKYPVKRKHGDTWKYDHALLVDAARRARMNGDEALATRADRIRERLSEEDGDSMAKALSLDVVRDTIYRAFDAAFAATMPTATAPSSVSAFLQEIFDDHVIAEITVPGAAARLTFSIPYAVGADGAITFDLTKKTPVTREWVPKSPTAAVA